MPRLAKKQEEEPEEEDQEDEEALEEAELEPSDQLESSLEELLARRLEVPEEEDPLLEPTAEERMDSLTVRAAPRQPNEFVCANCHLVKHSSQLADRRRQLCLDCV